MRPSNLYAHTVGSLTITIMTCLVGCQSTPRADFKMEPRKISIATCPEGATVYQVDVMTGESAELGLSPIREQPVTAITHVEMHNMPAREAQRLMKVVGGNICIRIEKDGYKTYTGYLATKRGEIVAHEVTLHAEQGTSPEDAGAAAE